MKYILWKKFIKWGKIIYDLLIWFTTLFNLSNLHYSVKLFWYMLCVYIHLVIINLVCTQLVNDESLSLRKCKIRTLITEGWWKTWAMDDEHQDWRCTTVGDWLVMLNGYNTIPIVIVGPAACPHLS